MLKYLTSPEVVARVGAWAAPEPEMCVGVGFAGSETTDRSLMAGWGGSGAKPHTHFFNNFENSPLRFNKLQS